jgi:hypothetical protein
MSTISQRPDELGCITPALPEIAKRVSSETMVKVESMTANMAEKIEKEKRAGPVVF